MLQWCVDGVESNCAHTSTLTAPLLLLQKGDRVGIWAPNCAEWVVLQFAAAKAGAVLVRGSGTRFVCHETFWKGAGSGAVGLILEKKHPALTLPCMALPDSCLLPCLCDLRPPNPHPPLLQVNINPAYRASELAFALTQAGVSVLVLAPGLKGGRQFLDMADSLGPGQVPQLRHRVLLFGADPPPAGAPAAAAVVCVHPVSGSCLPSSGVGKSGRRHACTSAQAACLPACLQATWAGRS